nr:argininosuccinate synthase [Acidobacteriota bacterium]NIO58427.1 argininosuccinate synthase [Acidobacteriota bacterium]NIQ29611.1 argininosuccinate synthase [Acidobacteriota bacterium]NIT10191.1 argininosuccinate synthase [Acidobacteriota bacterium]
YLLGTSLARPLIAKHHIEVAREHGASAVAHGATGKGNDQVRFELAYAALAPNMEVISPWKERAFLERFKGRRDLLRYAEEQRIEVEATRSKPFSTDENLMHRSYEAGLLEDPSREPPQDTFSLTRPLADARDEPSEIEIRFKDAQPVGLEDRSTGSSFEDPVELYTYLNRIAGEHAIGRIDIVENRFVGIKSRGVYETPAATVLHAALRDLEGIAMDREVLRLRDSLSPKFTELIYNGFWFSPEMDFIRAAFDQAEELIDGHVRLRLYKGNVMVLGRESPSSLYDRELASMDVEGGYDQSDARGFIRINALRLKAHKVIVRGAGKP